MTTFGEYVREIFTKSDRQLLLVGPDTSKIGVALTVQSASRPIIVANEALHKGMLDILQSTSFLDNVSSEIGQPGCEETEDNFVQRGSAIIEQHLRRILLKK